MFDEQVSVKPDLYPEVQQFIDAMWNGHWTPNEFAFTSDVLDFQTKFTDQEKEMLVKALSAIGQIEVAVKTFWAKLGDNLPHPAFKDLGYVMANIEVIHNKSYVKLMDKLDLGHIFEENLKLDIIMGRVKYLRKYNDQIYTDKKKQYAYAIALFTLFVENVSLFSQFYTVCWLSNHRNAIKDVDNQVSYTAKEETAHALSGTWIINKMRSEYPELFDDELIDRIRHEAKEAYKAEAKIVDWMIGDFTADRGRFSAEVMKDYIKMRIDDSLKGINIQPVFEGKCNREETAQITEWFEIKAVGSTSTDFFAKRPTEYTKGVHVDAEDLF